MSKQIFNEEELKQPSILNLNKSLISKMRLLKKRKKQLRRS